MNSFNNLDHYIIPAKLLLKLTVLYQQIGKLSFIKEKMEKDFLLKLQTFTLNEDTYYLSLMLNLKVSPARLKQLIEKDQQPKNNEEQKVINLKKVLQLINSDAAAFNLNASELISYCNMVMSSKIVYNKNTLEEVENKIKHNYSIRFLINRSFDEFDDVINNKKYENLIAISIMLLDLFNLKPLSEHNDLGLYLTTYYLFKRLKFEIINYQSLFKELANNHDALLDEYLKTNINYFNGFSDPTEIAYKYGEVLILLHEQLEKIAKEVENKKSGNKQLFIETTILKMPVIFTKQDIRALHPEVSDATIVRALNKLKDQGLIMPLSTGRNASWRKCIENLDEVDLSKLLGE